VEERYVVKIIVALGVTAKDTSEGIVEFLSQILLRDVVGKPEILGGRVY
jgi:hypothetical protein